MGYGSFKIFMDRMNRWLRKIRYSHRKITCPNCYRKFFPYEVHFRCQDPACDRNKTSTPQVFPVNSRRWTRHFFIPLKEKCHGVIFTPQGNKPGCGAESRIRVCPFCHHELFLDAGLMKTVVIAIVGGPGSAKSHYIVELYRRLRGISQIGIIPQINIGEKNPDFDNLVRSVYPEGGDPRILPTTLVPKRYHFVINFPKLQLVLTFYDNPGEHWEPGKLEKEISDRSRYIGNADGIILLIDLLQLDTCRVLTENLGKSLPAKRTWSQADVVQTLYREARKVLHDTDKIHKPVAVCLTKIDEMEVDFSSDRKLYDILANGTVKWKEYDVREQEEISERLEKRLNRWDNNLSPIIEAWFSSKSYFAVAPLGCRPDSSGTIKKLNPIRVEDPFFWILHQLGLSGKEESGV
jgi:hypothetical protein